MNPQFVIRFNDQEDWTVFTQLCGWLIQQTGMGGWKFRSRWYHALVVGNDKQGAIYNALQIDDQELAMLAKLTYPDVLIRYDDLESQLSEYFFYDNLRFRKVDSPNYDIIPKRL